MSRKTSYSFDDEPNDLVRRYERFIEGQGPGYFDVEELETIVDHYLYKGRTKESSSALELGLKLHPSSVELKTKRAKIYLVVGNYQKASHILNSLGESNDYEVILLRIEVLLKMGQHKEAYQMSVALINSETEELDNITLDLGYIFITQLDYDTAIEFLEIGEKYSPNNTDLLFELAFCYEQIAEEEKSIKIYHRIINIDAYSSEAWFNLGQLYFALQDFENAIDAYDFVLVINENDALAMLQKAHAHFQIEEYKEAIELYLSFDKLGIDEWQANLFIAECYEKLELYDQAIVHYNITLTLDPDSYDALTGLTICYLEKEDYVESLIYVQKALVVQENAPDAWVYLAETLVGMEDMDNALLAYLKSVALDPNQPDTYMAIANICMDKMEYKTALQYYLTAYEQDETVEHIHLFIAVAFFKTGNLSGAKLFLKKAIDQNLDASIAFFELCPEADKNDFEAQP